MDRRKFISAASLTAVSISAFGHIQPSQSGFKGDCDTTNDILGPFYRPNAPTRQDLTYDGLSGNVVQIKGQVFQADCETPIKNALVEIWHCNTEGEYDNKSKHYRQRAKWYTNEKGEYSFKSILPGKYLNGSQFRPAHIHFRVSGASHKELISQIYFQGDPHITDDPWASDQKARLRILPISLEDISGNLTVNFDIVLADK